MAEQVALYSEAGLGFGIEDSEEVIGLAQGELGVRECEHGRECGGLGAREGPCGSVAGDEGARMVDVHGKRGDFAEREPADGVALDGEGQIVEGCGAVGEPEVDCGDGVGAGSGVAPEEIGCVPVVVRPLGAERGQ